MYFFYKLIFQNLFLSISHNVYIIYFISFITILILCLKYKLYIGKFCIHIINKLFDMIPRLKHYKDVINVHFVEFRLKLNRKMLHSNLVYKFKCNICNNIYYGKTKRNFKVRACKHLGITPLTEKKVKSPK